MGTREGKRMSRGQSQTRTQPGRRILGRCKEKEKINNVVLIDVDSCKSHDFIIVDIPESSQRVLQGSKVSDNGKESPSSNVISIDDDDDEDNIENGEEVGGDQETDVTPRKESPLASSRSRSPEESDSDGDECEFTHDKTFPRNLSKCKRTYSGKKLMRNRFGLGSDSERSSSDSGSSDCEVMEGSSGKIREQWESAASKRRTFKYGRNGQSGVDYQASASGSFTDAPENFEVEKTTERDSPDCYHSNNGTDGEDLSNSAIPGDGTTVDPLYDPMETDFVLDFDHTFFQETPSWFKTQSWEKAHFPRGNIDIRHGGEKLSEEPSDTEFQSDTNANYGGSGPRNKEQNPEGPRSCSSQDQGDSHSNSGKVCFQDNEENIPGEYSWSKTQSRYETFINHDKTGLQNEEASASKNRKLDETQVNSDKFIPQDEDGRSLETSDDQSRHETFMNAYVTQFQNEEACASSKRKSDEAQVNCDKFTSQNKDQGLSQETSFGANNGVASSVEKEKAVAGENVFCRTQLWHGTETFPEKSNRQDKEKPPSRNPSLSNVQQCKREVNHMRACINDEEEIPLQSPFNKQPQLEKTCVLLNQERDSVHDTQNDLIGEREKFKESDEYKRAMEEEWASRQRELQIQAEEAQRLKKRKKAETLRLLDMERRQKQRLEEMRKTQKKDVETLNLKEDIRAEVRKELGKLELMFSDMASLLRYLGIHVRDGVYPLSHEVHAAYKQALLRFHPDRASRTDIRQQVEAEEKFKLITRLKEKLLPT